MVFFFFFFFFVSFYRRLPRSLTTKLIFNSDSLKWHCLCLDKTINDLNKIWNHILSENTYNGIRNYHHISQNIIKGTFDLCLFGFVGFLFFFVSGKGCGLCLWHSLDFSLTLFMTYANIRAGWSWSLLFHCSINMYYRKTLASRTPTVRLGG